MMAGGMSVSDKSRGEGNNVSWMPKGIGLVNLDIESAYFYSRI